MLGDAYSYETLKESPNDFDIIIEDGSHKIEDMSFVVVEYVKKLKPNGILVVEDIPDFNWTNILKNLIPDNYKVEVKDLRRVRGRYDDILMIIRS